MLSREVPLRHHLTNLISTCARGTTLRAPGPRLAIPYPSASSQPHSSKLS